MKTKIILRFAWTNWGIGKIVDEVNKLLEDGWVITNFLSLGRIRTMLFLDMKKLDPEDLDELKEYEKKYDKLGFRYKD